MQASYAFSIVGTSISGVRPVEMEPLFEVLRMQAVQTLKEKGSRAKRYQLKRKHGAPHRSRDRDIDRKRRMLYALKGHSD